MGVPLSDKVHNPLLLIIQQVFYALSGVSLIAACQNGLQTTCFQNGVQNTDELNLFFHAEMATFLTAVGIPIVGNGFVKGFERFELNPILVFIMLADIYQIFCKCLVILRLQIVLVRVFVACATSAIRHPPRGAVAESLKYGIGTAFLYLEHNLALAFVAFPMVWAIQFVLETFHFCSQTFPFSHVMRFAMCIVWVVSATDVVTENVPVQTGRTYHPVYKHVYLLIAPFAAHPCPPAKTYPPAFYRLTSGKGVNHVRKRINLWSFIQFVRKHP